jgi:hypothetical protein
VPRFRLDERRTEPKPDRRLGIKLEGPISARGLGGKLDAYVPPELRYDYQPPSMFAQYKVLTAVFVAVGLGLLILWASVVKHSPPPSPNRPGAAAPAVPQAPQDQPIYIVPLPSK